jgi:hypothetical protein
MKNLLAKSSELIDELSRHWPDASELMFNSPCPLACENSDGHAWVLVQLGETVTEGNKLWGAVHARLGAGRRRRLFTLMVHTQTLVCAPELEVQACNMYIRRDHASIPGESASNAWHVNTVYTCHSHPVGG